MTRERYASVSCWYSGAVLTGHTDSQHTRRRRPLLLYPPWEQFFDACIGEIFTKGGWIVDIGGGLRIVKGKGNSFDEERYRKYGHYLKSLGLRYTVTDRTDTYHPDHIEDIHALSFPDDSIDSIICLAVLEHVEDPKKAAEEIVRVLKKGGMGLIYVPFIYRYHAHRSDYQDFYRYSKDAIRYLFRDCSVVQMCYVRGLFESLLRFTPLHTLRPFTYLTRALDHSCTRMRELSQKQTSGYNVFIVK